MICWNQSGKTGDGFREDSGAGKLEPAHSPVGPGCAGLTHDMGAVFFGAVERCAGANFDGCWGTA